MTYDQKYRLKLAISYLFGHIFKTSGSRVLMYHSINQKIPDDIHNIYNLKKEIFKQQIQFLTSNKKYKLKSIENILDETNCINITFDDGCKSILYSAYPILMQYKIPFTIYISPKLILNDGGTYLNKKELLDLSNNKYCTVGAHGYSHSPLTSLSTQEARKEIMNSKKWLEDELGRGINHMSYPHGAYNRTIMKIVDDSGFISAATSNAGANTKNQNKLKLNRTTILSHDNIYHFVNKLNGNWDWIRLIPI